MRGVLRYRCALYNKVRHGIHAANSKPARAGGYERVSRLFHQPDGTSLLRCCIVADVDAQTHGRACVLQVWCGNACM